MVMESVSSRQTAASRDPPSGLRVYMQSMRQAAAAVVARNESSPSSKTHISFPRLPKRQFSGEESTMGRKDVEKTVYRRNNSFPSSDPTARETKGLANSANSARGNPAGLITAPDEIEKYRTPEKNAKRTSEPSALHGAGENPTSPSSQNSVDTHLPTTGMLQRKAANLKSQIPSRLVRLAKSSGARMMSQTTRGATTSTTTSTTTTTEDNKVVNVLPGGNNRVIRVFKKNNNNHSRYRLTKNGLETSTTPSSKKSSDDSAAQSRVNDCEVLRGNEESAATISKSDGGVDSSSAILVDEALKGHETPAEELYSLANSGDLSKTSTRVSIDRCIMENFSLESREEKRYGRDQFVFVAQLRKCISNTKSLSLVYIEVHVLIRSYSSVPLTMVVVAVEVAVVVVCAHLKRMFCRSVIYLIYSTSSK